MRNTLNDLLNEVVSKELLIERLKTALDRRKELKYNRDTDLQVLSLVYEYGYTAKEVQEKLCLSKEDYVENLLNDIRKTIVK